MVDLNTQPVRDLLSNLLILFLNVALFIWTLFYLNSQSVRCYEISSHSFWPHCGCLIFSGLRIRCMWFFTLNLPLGFSPCSR